MCSEKSTVLPPGLIVTITIVREPPDLHTSYAPDVGLTGGLITVGSNKQKPSVTWDLRLLKTRLCLFEFGGMRRVVGRLAPELIVLDYGFDDAFLLIGHKLELDTDVEVFRT